MLFQEKKNNTIMQYNLWFFKGIVSTNFKLVALIGKIYIKLSAIWKEIQPQQ